MTGAERTRAQILRFALTFPASHEDHPWGEVVVKVANKIFVFLGVDAGPQDLGMTVKLPESLEQALMVQGAAPTGYGLGRAGWVTIPFRPTTPPLPVLKDWVEESYRTVAPRRLLEEWEARPRRR
jgi:predicted DNA-binding protein (MmcQ/YjbR family)